MVWAVSYGYVNRYNSKEKKLPRTSNTGTILDVDKIQAWLGWQAAGETVRVSTGKEPAVQGAVTHVSTRSSDRDLESTCDFMTTTIMLKKYRLAQKHAELLFCS